MKNGVLKKTAGALSAVLMLGSFLYGSMDVLAGRLDSAALLAADAVFFPHKAGAAAQAESSEEPPLLIERKPLEALFPPQESAPEQIGERTSENSTENNASESSEQSSESSLPQVPQVSHAPDSFCEMTLSGGSERAGISVIADEDTEEIDFAQLLLQAPNFEVPSGDAPCVLIYHTHTCESYVIDGDDSARSEDLSRGVVAVGEAMAQVLRQNGIGVIHDTAIYDTTYSGSYARSEAAAREILAENPSITITVDLHRDSLRTASGERIRPTASVLGHKAAQIMILAGCDPDGSLDFPGWKENLCFALHLHKNLLQLSEDLPRPLYYCNRVYNMFLTPASVLVEVGTDGNYLDEAIWSGELLGQALSAVILSAQEAEG